jgi:hypothetical protein
MTRLFLLILLGIVTWIYFPDTRAILLDAAEPIVTPIMKWNAGEEMSQVARNVVEHERLHGELPSGGAWLGWLDSRYPSTDMRIDPWGSVYQLEVLPDSVAIISLGPDRTRLTDDDFRATVSRGS